MKPNRLCAWLVRAAERRALQVDLRVRAHAKAVLGERRAHLLWAYGRIMSGPHHGSYVSGLPAADARALVDALEHGREVDVHLMHRHRSGNYESSTLRWVAGTFVMRFADREELA